MAKHAKKTGAKKVRVKKTGVKKARVIGPVMPASVRKKQERERKQKKINEENMYRVGKYQKAYDHASRDKLKLKEMLKKAQAAHSKTQRRLKMLTKRQARLKNQSAATAHALQDTMAKARDYKNHRDDMLARFREASKDASEIFRKKKAAEKKMNNFVSRYTHVLM